MSLTDTIAIYSLFGAAFAAAISWAFIWVELLAIFRCWPWIFRVGIPALPLEVDTVEPLCRALIPGEVHESKIGLMVVTDSGLVVVRPKGRSKIFDIFPLKVSARIDCGVAKIVAFYQVGITGFCCAGALFVLALGVLAITNGPFPERLPWFLTVFLVLMAGTVLLVRRSVLQVEKLIGRAFRLVPGLTDESGWGE